MRKGRKYRFYEKPQSFGGKYALLLAGISVLLFFISVFISSRAGGNAGTAAGAPALLGLLLSVCSFIAGIRSFREKDTLPGCSIAGTRSQPGYH